MSLGRFIHRTPSDPAFTSSQNSSEPSRIDASREQSLRRVGLALVGVPDDLTICRTVYAAIAELVDAPHFLVSTFDIQTHRVHTPYAVVDGREVDTATIASASYSQTSSAEPRILKKFGENDVIQSGLYLPLVVGDTVIGAMELQSYKPAAYSANDLPLLMGLSNQAAVALEHTRLLEETARRVREFESLYHVTEAIASASSLDEMLTRIHAQIMQLMEADNCYIALWEPSEQLLIFQYFADEYSGMNRGDTRAGGNGLTEYIIRSGRSLLLQSHEQLEFVRAREGLAHYGRDSHSLLGVPMWHQGRVIGALVVQSYTRENAYSPDDQRILETIASQAAVAIEKARVYEQAERRAREQAVLRDLLVAMSTVTDLDSIITRVTDFIRENMSPDNCGFLMLDAERGVLRFHPSYFGVLPSTRATEITLGFGVIGQVAVSGRPEIVRDTRGQPDLIALAGTPARSELCVPLHVNDGTVGVINIESAQTNSFGEADLQFVVALAQQVASMMDRVRLFDETRRRADQMAAFNAVVSTVNEWLEIDQIAKRILGVLLQVTQNHMGLVYLVKPNGSLELLADFGFPAELSRFYLESELVRHPALENAVAAGHIVSLDDLPNAAISANARELARRTGINSAIIVPLRSKGRVTGFSLLANDNAEARVTEPEFLQSLADQAAQSIENARLFAESQWRLEEQSALRELAQRFLVAVNPDEVLERTLETLSTLIPADYYDVLLPDGDGEAFILAAGRGWRPGVVGRTRIAKGAWSQAGYTVMRQTPVHVVDFATETRFRPSENLVRHQVASALCAPMLADQRVIGLLGVYSRAPEQFTPEQSHFLYLIATQTAIALEKARHSQAAQRRLEELMLLTDVNQSATSALSLDKVLLTIVSEVGQLLNSDRVHIYFVNEETSELVVGASLHQTYADMKRIDLRLGAGIPGWVAQTGQPLLVPDVRNEKRYQGQDELTHSEICVPMRIGARIIGVIAVEHPRVNAFDENDLRLLSTLAAQVASTIERARLLETTQQRLNELTALFEMTNRLRTATTEQELLDLTIYMTTRVLNAVGGSLQLISPDGATLTVRSVHNFDTLGLHLPRQEHGLSWEAIETGESLVVDDVQTDPRVVHRHLLRGSGAAIIAPFRTPTGILGTLLVGFAPGVRPPASALHLATTIANLTANALQRLTLHDQTVKQAEHLATALRDLEDSYQATLLALSAALDARDRETKGHSVRVTELALTLARELCLPAEELRALERGALLHDVGKIGISDNILLKPGPLNETERKIMNEHPRLGYEMLRGVKFLNEALPVVLHHQERFDGSGYPHGLRGEEIPLVARIFAVADAYDAMTSTRPYRAAMSHDEAIVEIMRETGKQFDPKVAETFLRLFANEH